MKFFSCMISLFLAASSCKHAASITEKEKITISNEVISTLKNYYADIKKSGLTAEFNYLDASSDFFWLPPGYTTPISYDSVSAIIKQNAMKFTSVNNTFETLKVIPLSKELATYSGRLRSIMTDTSGTNLSFTLVETGVMIHRKDGWKLLHGQTSMLE